MARRMGIRLRSFGRFATAIVVLIALPTCLVFAQTSTSVVGHRTETNRFLINGVDWIGGQAAAVFVTPTGASSQLLGVEAVREYNVLEHTYGVESGKRA